MGHWSLLYFSDPTIQCAKIFQPKETLNVRANSLLKCLRATSNGQHCFWLLSHMTRYSGFRAHLIRDRDCYCLFRAFEMSGCFSNSHSFRAIMKPGRRFTPGHYTRPTSSEFVWCWRLRAGFADHSDFFTTKFPTLQHRAKVVFRGLHPTINKKSHNGRIPQMYVHMNKGLYEIRGDTVNNREKLGPSTKPPSEMSGQNRHQNVFSSTTTRIKRDTRI